MTQDGLMFQQTIQAAPTAVFYALTNAAALQEWLCDNAQVTGRSGGPLYFWWRSGYYVAGEYTDWVVNERVQFTWQGRGEPAATAVSITLTGQNNDQQTQLTLTHNGSPEILPWLTTRTEISRGWETGLTNLKAVLETGLDRRIYDVPFLGIIPTALVTAGELATLGYPAAAGIRIGGTAPHTGAAAAGLQADDILLTLDGVDLTTFEAIRTAVSPHKPGHELAVRLLRHGQEQLAHIRLSARPIPSVPPTPAEFATALQSIYAQSDQTLEDILMGVTDSQAEWRPRDGAWCVKDILAHLLGSERVTQMNIALQLSDLPGNNYPHNPPAWTDAITAVYPTLTELVQIWKQTEAETIALVARLPESFVARKATYLNLGNLLLSGLPEHTHTHITEIHNLVTAAATHST